MTSRQNIRKSPLDVWDLKDQLRGGTLERDRWLLRAMQLIYASLVLWTLLFLGVVIWLVLEYLDEMTDWIRLS